jgi:hypothetical protein
MVNDRFLWSKVDCLILLPFSRMTTSSLNRFFNPLSTKIKFWIFYS